jgi:hypothetical protein
MAFGGSAHALAAQRYASPAGSGSACTSGTPCDLQTAVNGSSAGDEVIVNPGDYGPIAATIGPLNNNTYIHGVYGQPPPRLHFSSGYLRIDNPGDRGSYLQVDGATTPPLQVGGTASEGDQIYAHATANNACVVYGTLIDSVCWASGASDNAISGAGSATFTPILRNVTAEGTGAGGVGIEYHASSGGHLTLTAVNVIVHGTSTDIQVAATAPDSMTVNIDHSNFVTATPTGSGASINSTAIQGQPPLFVNAAGGDFNEVPGSPTINAGVTSAANGPFDLLGRPRTIGGATDIGAYEYDSFNGVTLGGGKARVKKGKAPVRVGCPAGIPSPCAGTLTLSYQHGSKTSVAGKASFSIAAGVTQKLNVKLKKPAFRRLDDRGKLKVSAFADATDGAGTHAGTSGKVKLTA